MGLKNTFLLVFVFVVVGTRKAQAAQHLVGGSQGWDESTDFNSWVSKQTFKVGDTLVFKYTGLHSLVELPNESAYKSCNLGSALNKKNTGNDVIKLDKTGTRYFSCGTLGHCNQGMKVKITTAEGGGNSPNSSPTSTSTSAASVSYSFASSIVLLATLILTTLSVLRL